jgi:uncharacterized protein (DUF2164 family)
LSRRVFLGRGLGPTPEPACRCRDAALLSRDTFSVHFHAFAMPLEIPAQQTSEIIHSLQKYVASELDQDIGDLQARLLLDYILKEIAPIAYNAGVRDAEQFLRGKLEDLPATCFEPELTYWQKKRKGA